MADSTRDPHNEDPVDEVEDFASQLSARLQKLTIDPEKGYTTVQIYPEDLEEWREFLQFKKNRRKWVAWRVDEWKSKHPPYIQAIFENCPTLQTTRLTLRKLRRDDAQEAFRVLSQPINIQYYGWKTPHVGVEQTRQDFIDAQLERFKFRHSITFVITFTGVDKYIGHITAMFPDAGFKIVELSYLIGHEYWNKGIGTEAIGRVVEFLLDDMKIHKIRANYWEKNVASKRVLEKLGFEQEGYLKDHVIIDGAYQGEYCMAKFPSSKDGEQDLK